LFVKGVVMSSESTEDGGVHVELAADLDEWLTEQAETLDVPREAVMEQLLAAYRASAEFDDETADAHPEADELDAVVAATVDERLSESVETATESAVSSYVPDIVDTVERQLADRFDTLEADFQAKIDDVRERVVQVKREADAKAPADHSHEEFDHIDALSQDIEGLEGEIADLRADVTEALETQDEQLGDIDDIDDRLDDVEDKLTRVAWVVSDLRDEQGGRDQNQKAVDRLKRAAAQENISTARCSNCSEQVEIGLLTEPQCPHCSATVSDVRPEGGIIRSKARLVAAAQLGPGEGDE
jgi:chromosome segregation ATPase